MPTPNPPAATIFTWLKQNLGPRCLAPLTSVDAAALKASVQLAELCCYQQNADVLAAYRITVLQMQPHCRRLAFHAIAHVRDWSDRREMWVDSGLIEDEPITEAFGRCKFE